MLKGFGKKKGQCRLGRSHWGAVLKPRHEWSCLAFRIAVAMVAATGEAEGMRNWASYLFPEVLAQRAETCCVFDM